MADISKLMSQKQIDRRKRTQGTIARTTSTIGLTGLGVLGASVAARKNPETLKAIQRLHPKLKAVTPEKMKDATVNAGIVSGGLSGLGGYNFASYTSAEAKRNKMKTKLKKNLDHELDIEPVYGDVGIAKNWTPVATDYDPEAKRHKRNQVEQHAAYAGAGTAGLLSAVSAGKAVKPHKLAGRVVPKNPQNPKSVNAAKGQATRLKNLSRGHLKTSGKYAAGGLVLAGTGEAIRRNRKGSWQSYSKSASASAFGITHD